MSQSEQQYLTELRQHASASRALLSNAQKPERERMVVRAFLRCIGVPFADQEIQASTEEPVDTIFRSARFQVRDVLRGRRRGKELVDRQRRYEEAQRLSDLLEPWDSSKPVSFRDVTAEIAQALAEKASRYGSRNCAVLDALLYVDIKGHHLFPLEFRLDDETAAKIALQGWRSVSFLFLPYGVVLTAKPTAPEFVRDRLGEILNQWPHPDGWFDAE